MKSSLLLLALIFNAGLDATHPGASEFIDEVSQRHELPRQEVADLLAGAELKQSIIKAISRPAEAKPWSEYRPIFITNRRINDGVEFWRENADLLAEVEHQYGVPAWLIVAITGVETSYGRIQGSFRVLDALATLAFHYPPRARFFRSELEQYLLLGREERLALDELKGSYAGAMGLGQFISSSYRAYAVDHDGDGRRDLWGSRADALASIANYFRRHGWQPGQPVAEQVTPAAGARTLTDLSLKPQFPVNQLAEWGYPASADEQTPATLVQLSGASGPEVWVTYQNFYAISRYNHSALYSLAVYQLGQAINEKMASDS